jgi:type VI protein secretion system component Hcp
LDLDDLRDALRDTGRHNTAGGSTNTLTSISSTRICPSRPNIPNQTHNQGATMTTTNFTATQLVSTSSTERGQKDSTTTYRTRVAKAGRFGAAALALTAFGGFALNAMPAQAQATSSAKSVQVLDGSSSVAYPPTVVPISGFQNGVVAASSFVGGNATIGRPELKAARFTKLADSMSPLFYRTMTSGGSIRSLEIKRGQTTYRYGLVFLTGIEVSDAPAVANGDADYETISFIYAQIEILNGKERTCYSAATNRLC